MIIVSNMGVMEVIVIMVVMMFVLPIILRSVMGSIQTTPVSFEINWEAANDEEVRKHLPHRYINAIKAYRALTYASLAEAKYVIDYLIANPDDYGGLEGKKKKSGMMSDEGIRELIMQGRLDDAIITYKTFTGLSHDEAVAAIEQIEQEVELGRPTVGDESEQQYFSS